MEGVSRELQQLVTDATTSHNANAYGQKAHRAEIGRLQELIADLQQELATAERRVTHIDAWLTGGGADYFFARLAQKSGDADPLEVWSTLLSLMKLFGTLPPDALARLGAEMPPFLEYPAGTPVVFCDNLRLPGGGWYGTRLARPPYLRYLGSGAKYWAVRITCERPPNDVPPCHNQRLPQVAANGWEQTLADYGMYVGSDAIRAQVAVVLAHRPESRDKIIRALWYAGLPSAGWRS